MQLTINISNEQLFDKIVWLLNSFKNDGLEIIESKHIDSFKSDNSKEEILDKESVLSSFRDAIKDIKKLKDGDNSVLYNGSLDDMMRELR